MTPDKFAKALAAFKADTPEALNARLLARIAEMERQIAELQTEIARHQAGHAASVLAGILAKAGDAQMDDPKFREFVRLAGAVGGGQQLQPAAASPIPWIGRRRGSGGTALPCGRCRVPRKATRSKQLGTPADMRRDMIERADAARAQLVTKLECRDLSPNQRHAVVAALQAIDMRLLDLRQEE